MDIENIIEDAKEAGFHTTGDWKVQIQPSQYDGISNENIFIAITKFAEIRNKRAVASAEVLVEALTMLLTTREYKEVNGKDYVYDAMRITAWDMAEKALATYDKQIEVKHEH